MKELMKRSAWIILFLICAPVVIIEGVAAVDFAWNWAPKGSTYTSGPGGDIVYDLYMRDDDDPDYAYDYPLMAGIDDCVWENDRYTCQASLDYDFVPGMNYYFIVVAYLSGNPTLRSAPSNEVRYYEVQYHIDPADEEPAVSDSVAEEGGGCLIDSKIIEFFFGCDTNR